MVVAPGAARWAVGVRGAYGFGLRRFDSATLHKAFDGVRFDAGANFELDLGPGGPDQALAFGALIERYGAKPEDCAVSFGLDPFATLTRGLFAAAWNVQASRYAETSLALRSQGFAGPFLVADARSIHAAGGTPAQELAFALAAAVALLRMLEQAGMPLDEARSLIAFRLAADVDELATLSKFRALRIAWSRVEEACGVEPRAAHVQAESAWRMMTNTRSSVVSRPLTLATDSANTLIGGLSANATQVSIAWQASPTMRPPPISSSCGHASAGNGPGAKR